MFLYSWLQHICCNLHTYIELHMPKSACHHRMTPDLFWWTIDERQHGSCRTSIIFIILYALFFIFNIHRAICFPFYGQKSFSYELLHVTTFRFNSVKLWMPVVQQRLSWKTHTYTDKFRYIRIGSFLHMSGPLCS